MEKNEEIVAFNQKYIAENTAWLASPLTAADATEKIVTQLVKENAAAVLRMEKVAAKSTGILVDCLGEAEGNRENISTNEAAVYSRRELIHANSTKIRENREAVRALLRNSVPNNGLLQALGRLLTATPTAPEPATPTSTASQEPLQEATLRTLLGSRAELFELEAAVFENRSCAYEARSVVEENAALINKNYHSAFEGNRQLTNQNTEDLFRNRLALMDTLAVDKTKPIQQAYAEALMIKQRVALLQHQLELDQQTLDVTLCAPPTARPPNAPCAGSWQAHILTRPVHTPWYSCQAWLLMPSLPCPQEPGVGQCHGH